MPEESTTQPASRKRTRKTRPYPVHTLEEALVIATTIHDGNAARPYDRVLLAKALGTTPASSGFTMKLNSASKYGLTEGGYSDENIVLTPLGESVFTAADEADRHEALLAAALRPELFQSFYELLDGKRLPDDTNAAGILHREFAVDPELTAECLGIIKHNGQLAGLLGDVGGSLYVSLAGSHRRPARNGQAPAMADRQFDGAVEEAEHEPDDVVAAVPLFIGHAGNSDVVDFLARILNSFDIPYRVVESDYQAGRPVAERVSREMRACGAAVLVFASPSDPEWAGRREEKRHEKLLYQLGAASALYGDRVVSLAEAGSNDAEHPSGFAALSFRRDRLDEMALSFLAELHRRGVIRVSAGPTRCDSAHDA
jgi:hypothetical protein